MKLTPYAEGEDQFVESTGAFISRLHFDQATGYASFRPIPPDALLQAFYNGDFSAPPPSYDQGVVNVVRGIIDHVGHYGVTAPFRAHDVGCAFGAGVYGFQQAGIDATGNEPNRAWVETGNAYCQGKLTEKPLAEALAGSGRSVDLFFSAHVLEHLPDPQGTLQTMAEHLTDRGLAYLCIPNGHSLRYLLGGRREDPCYEFPMHLNYFTPKSLVAMLRAAGLEPLCLETRWVDHLEVLGKGSALGTMLGLNEADIMNAAAWKAAAVANLLGIELFCLAARADNTSAPRDPNIDVNVERAYAAAMKRRGPIT